MSVLLIDIGNTRVKWAKLTGGKPGPQRAAAHAGWTAADFGRRLFRGGDRIGKVIVVSVAGREVEKRLVKAAHECRAAVPGFIRTPRSAAGVTTRYREPWRLGADRFVAAVGAYHLARGTPACVVDVGTAMTLDLVDGHGVHRGGAIVPGPALLVATLVKDTSGIRRRAHGAATTTTARGLFARDTRTAISQGARYATAATIDRAVEEARALLGVQPRVFLTGGAALSLRPLIRARHRLVPDLVLRGLARLA